VLADNERGEQGKLGKPRRVALGTGGSPRPGAEEAGLQWLT
jgi:hypothetical protein